MFGFLIKKNFCDGWDNLFAVFIVNVVCTLTGLGFLLLFLMMSKMESPFMMGLVLVVACIVLSVLVFAYGDSSATIAKFETPRLVDYFKAIPGVLKDGVLFGLMISAIVILSYIGIKYYWGEEFLAKFPMLGIFLGALLMWMDVFAILSLQWFLAIRSLMHNNFRKCLKKCMIIFMDNTGFSIAMLLYTIVLLAISVFFLGMMPAWAGITIAQTNAIRLRLYKYDYLEEHPELTTKRQRRKIPWEELIYEDRETLGPRKLKSFLFPWKE